MRNPTKRAAYVNAIGRAVPPHDAHFRYIAWAENQIGDARKQKLFQRMVQRSGIEHRWTVLPERSNGNAIGAHSEFYRDGAGSVPTSVRMAAYADAAPDLAMAAVEALGCPSGITHLVFASCTGFVAPGIDQIVARRLGLDRRVERVLVGFMGCYAGVTALRTAHHIVRSDQAARILLISVELCSLHLQEETEIEPLLAGLLFGDGAAAALISAEPAGLELYGAFSEALIDSDDLINWNIGDTGFTMRLSGEVPARLEAAVASHAFQERLGDIAGVDCWAVHAGGRTILEAVERGLGLGRDSLLPSYEVLRECGNMSSATLLFVLDHILASRRKVANGVAIAFGPGLAAEGLHFRTPPGKGEVCL